MVVAKKSREHTKSQLKTKDGLQFVYRVNTSDIKAIREACGNIDLPEEKKRSSSYMRQVKEPIFMVSPDDVWLDCGAQIGSFSLRAIKNGAKRVVSVEPEHENFDILKENIALNGYTEKIVPLNIAVVASDDIKTVQLNKTESTYKHTLM